MGLVIYMCRDLSIDPKLYSCFYYFFQTYKLGAVFHNDYTKQPKRRMTKILKILTVMVSIGLVSTFSNDLYGQMRAGIKGGLNVSNLYVNDVNDENARFGV